MSLYRPAYLVLTTAVMVFTIEFGVIELVHE